MVPNFWTAIYIYQMDKDAEISTEEAKKGTKKY